MSYRKIKSVRKSSPTIEGAGVHLKRAFGFHTPRETDPFLLLDDFRSDNPELYLNGFPWHPHRGIETITYMLDGRVEHGDSLGNSGVISAGGVQWMTAGSGIIHNEMPKGDSNGVMGGFQLWANLPKKNKMIGPRYQEYAAKDIPEFKYENGIRIKLICGEVEGVKGPVENIIINPEYLDIAIPTDSFFTHKVADGYTVFAYVIAGSAYFDGEAGARSTLSDKDSLVLFERQGRELGISTGKAGVRFLLISGRPLDEPIAWYGPIVMNTDEEIQEAFEEYRNGTFLKNQ